MKYLVSILIPTFNSSEFLKETLDSILFQAYKNWECIIVDDNSTDNTVAILKEYSTKDDRFSYHIKPKNINKGANSGRNYALSFAKGNFIQWFDSDDIMLKDHLKDKLSNIKLNDYDAIVNKIAFWENNKVLKFTKIKSDNLITDYAVGKVSFYTQGVLWNSEFIKKQNKLFDVKISNLDDWDFIIRMLIQKPRLKILDSYSVLYRQHANSLTQEIAKLNISELRSEVNARFKILNILKNNQFKTDDVELFMKKRFIQLLRISLEKKNFKSANYCIEIIKSSRVTSFEFLKIKVGYFMYRYFNRGYRFLKY